MNNERMEFIRIGKHFINLNAVASVDDHGSHLYIRLLANKDNGGAASYTVPPPAIEAVRKFLASRIAFEIDSDETY
jgi:hypothetical protein